MTFVDELKSRNFSIYGQWTGVLCIVLCLAIGISSIFSGFIPWGIVCTISGGLLIFVEIPLLMRICPTSEKFDNFVKRFSTNLMRALIYFALSAAEWTSLIKGPSQLIVPAVFLLIACIFFLIAGMRGDDTAGSKTLGGQNIARMVV